MAYSPFTTSPVAGASSGPHPGRRSLSPPAQPISKRDKKRNQHIAHQQDLADDFALNRDVHYRSQLVGLQYDMNLITQADPYNPEPLEDSPDEIAKLVEGAVAGNPYQAEVSSLAGRYYADFVQEVNDAKEAKDVQLVQVMNDHQTRLARLRYECEYRVHLAGQEFEHLSSTIRERMLQYLSHKKQRLLKEKEHLDIADTNTLLLHPSQFTITNPSSPGGGQTSRKTRYTRQRTDMEELGNGVAPEGYNKRKRKANDDEGGGSPGREGILTPAERAKARVQAHQTAPLYSIHTLFTEKELNFQTHQAHIATRHFFSTSHKNGDTNSTSKRNKDSDAEHSPGSGDESDPEEDGILGSADMDRTASQTFHVTRSTRNIGGLAGLNILSDLAEKAATRPTLPYATLHTHQAKAGTFLPPVSRLMPEEVDEDMSKITELSTQPSGYVDKKALADALKPLWESRSSLAPDWPLYVDVHLVDLKQVAT